MPMMCAAGRFQSSSRVRPWRIRICVRHCCSLSSTRRWGAGSELPMQSVETIEQLRQARSRFAQLGFVPTIGYLHAGHLSLIRQARARYGAVAASIFVNPTQFGPHEDLSRYPRDPERDLQLLRQEQVDLLFTPAVAEIYPPGYSTYIEVEGLSTRLEGLVRPGHFRGVATVVCKLLHIVQP